MARRKKPSRISRRDFLKAAAVSLAAPAGLAAANTASASQPNGPALSPDSGSRAPTLVPSRVLGRPAPSDTLALGCIGVGRQGQGDMQEAIYRGLETGARVVAVCDVDSHRVEDAQWLVDKIYAEEAGGKPSGCAAYRDFRELLARKDIDGVLIVTPDHWHAFVALAAAEARKDIYLEKPLTYSIAEGRKLVAAVRRNKIVLQTGSQQRSQEYFRLACELVRNQAIGTLFSMRVTLPPDQGAGDPRPQPVPRNLDYDFWLGPAALAPFCEDRTHPQRSYERPGWLQIEAYCRGMITGWGSHMNDIAQWGNGTDLSGPVEVEATGEFPDRGLFDVHQAFKAECVYANGVRLFQETGEPAGVRFEGDRGWIFASREELRASDPALLKVQVSAGGVRLYRSTNHMKDFLEAMRTRKDPAAPVEVGHRSNSVCVITHIAMKLRRRLKWDPAAEQFVGDEEANRWLDYPHRAPWTV
jgi:myo-inositol 2-dehydrogenase / D-chiro-inositol 1-dehydrogenase